jgi:hypothetical protein
LCQTMSMSVLISQIWCCRTFLSIHFHSRRVNKSFENFKHRSHSIRFFRDQNHSCAYAWTANPIRLVADPTNPPWPPHSFVTACNNGSRHRFTPRLHPIFSVRIPRVSITDVAPEYISETIRCVHSGKCRCLIVDMISSCGTDPNAFVKSIAIRTRLSLFRFALRNNSFNIIPCSLHPFVFLMDTFWLSENMHLSNFRFHLEFFSYATELFSLPSMCSSLDHFKYSLQRDVSWI